MSVLRIIITLVLYTIVVRVDRRMQRRAARRWCIERGIVPKDAEVDE